MLERTQIYVDTSYLLASFYNSWDIGARAQLEIDLPEVVAVLGHMVQDQFKQPVHRQFWYDGIPDSGPHRYQRSLRSEPGVQLRAGQLIEWGERRTQKAVDTRLVADMVIAAMKGQVSDIVLVSGDADMLPGVEEAVNAGIRVHLFGFGWDSMSSALRFACDTTAILDPREDFRDTMRLEILEGPLAPEPTSDITATLEPTASSSSTTDAAPGRTSAYTAGEAGTHAATDETSPGSTVGTEAQSTGDQGTVEQGAGTQSPGSTLPSPSPVAMPGSLESTPATPGRGLMPPPAKPLGDAAAPEDNSPCVLTSATTRADGTPEQPARQTTEPAGPARKVRSENGSEQPNLEDTRATQAAQTLPEEEDVCAEGLAARSRDKTPEAHAPRPQHSANAGQATRNAPGAATGSATSAEPAANGTLPEAPRSNVSNADQTPTPADAATAAPKPLPNPGMMARHRKLRSRYVPLPNEVWASAGEQTPYEIGQQYALWWFDNAASEEEKDSAHMLSGGGLPPNIDRPLLQFACETLHEYTLSESQRVGLRDGFHSGIRAIMLR